MRNCQTVTRAFKSINQVMSLLYPVLPGASCYTENKSKPSEPLCNRVPASAVVSPPCLLSCSRPSVSTSLCLSVSLFPHNQLFLATCLSLKATFSEALPWCSPTSVKWPCPPCCPFYTGRCYHPSFLFTSSHKGPITYLTPSGPQLSCLWNGLFFFKCTGEMT